MSERFYQSGRLNVFHEEHVRAANSGIPDGFKPVAVIDPEDRDAVVTIAQRVGSVVAKPGEDISRIITAVADALRDLANPPKPEVYRHFIARTEGGLKSAACGKVWRPNAEANVTVVGDCPECAEMVRGGWSA